MSLGEDTLFMLKPPGFTSSVIADGPPDAQNQVWDVNVSYSTGDRVWHGGHAWTSDSDSNLGNTPGTTGWDDDGEVDGGYLAYNPATDYVEGDGAIDAGYIWKADRASTGVTPVEGLDWTRTFATNRFKAFDTYLQDPTTASGSLSYTLTPSIRVNTIAALRISGTSIRVTMEVPGEGVVFDETKELIKEADRINLYRYLFTPVEGGDQALFLGLPPFTGATITVNIAGPNAQAGQILYGISEGIGIVESGAVVGFEDFSRTRDDDYGRRAVVQGNYAETAEIPAVIASARSGTIRAKLAARRALPTLYFMDEGEAFGIVTYGWSYETKITVKVGAAQYLLQTRSLT